MGITNFAGRKRFKVVPKMKIASIINNSYPNEYGFDNLSFPLNKDELLRYFKNLRIETEKKWVEIVELFEKSTQDKKNLHTTSVEKEKQTEIYKKGTQYYSDNKELNDIQKKLKEENSKLQEIKGLEDKLTQLNIRKNSIITQIATDHSSYYSNAQSLVQNLNIEHDEVRITTKISCKNIEIKEFLESRLNNEDMIDSSM